MKAIEGEQSHMDKILDQLEGQVGGYSFPFCPVLFYEVFRAKYLCCWIAVWTGQLIPDRQRKVLGWPSLGCRLDLSTDCWLL